MVIDGEYHVSLVVDVEDALGSQELGVDGLFVVNCRAAAAIIKTAGGMMIEPTVAIVDVAATAARIQVVHIGLGARSTRTNLLVVVRVLPAAAMAHVAKRKVAAGLQRFLAHFGLHVTGSHGLQMIYLGAILIVDVRVGLLLYIGVGGAYTAQSRVLKVSIAQA